MSLKSQFIIIHFFIMDDVKIQILKKTGVVIGVLVVSAVVSYTLVGRYLKENER